MVPHVAVVLRNARDPHALGREIGVSQRLSADDGVIDKEFVGQES